MDLPTLDQITLLLPLREWEQTRLWLARGDGSGLEPYLVEQFQGEFLDDDKHRRAVVDEIEGLRALDHSLIVATVGAGLLDDHFAVVHRFPTGERLRDLVGAAAFDVPLATRIVADILEGLASAHETHGRFHGALHPGVIWVGDDGRARIGRFGSERLVRRARQNWGVLDPRELSYLSPEHCTNDPLDARTDVFNLATIFWELLTGRLLFREEDQFDRMRAICEEEAPPPSRYDDSIPPLLNSLVQKALSIEPDARFADATEVREVLRDVFARTQDPAPPERVADHLNRARAGRLDQWRRVREAIRADDLRRLVDRVAELYGVDVDEARIPLGGGTAPADDGSVSDDRLSQEERLEKLRQFEPDRPEADIHEEKTRRHASSGVTEDESFPVGDTELSEGPQAPANDAVSVDVTSEGAGDDVGEDLQPVDQLLEESEPVDATADDEPLSEPGTADGDSEPPAAETAELERSSHETAPLEDSPDSPGSSEPDDLASSAKRESDDRPGPNRPDTDRSTSGSEAETADPSDEPAEDDGEVERAARPEESVEASRRTAPDEDVSLEEVAAELRSMTIDEWIGEREERTREDEPFALADIIEDRGQPEQPRVPEPILEVVSTGGDQPLDVTVLRKGDDWSREDVPLEVDFDGASGLVTIEPPSSGWIVRADEPGERRDLPEPPADLELAPGDIAEINDGDVTYRLRLFHPPETPDHVGRATTGSRVALYSAAALVAILVHGLFAYGLIRLHEAYSTKLSVQRDPPKEVFSASMKEFEDEPEPERDEQEPPEPEETPDPPEPPTPSEQKARVPESVQKTINEKLQEKRQATEGADEGESMAEVLDPSSGEGDPGKEGLNIDSVEGKEGSSSDLEVGGNIGGGDGNEVSMETGGGDDSELGDLGSDLGEGTGNLDAREDKDEQVRGTVSSVDSQASVAGEISRSKVTRVVNRHMGQIRGCYENQLLDNPGLSGKVTIEWTITRSGAVTGARQKTSSLGSGAVSNCILGIVRGMSFPSPKGGSVTVSYPFVFRSGG